MSVRWWPFIHRVPGTCLNFPYVFGVLGWAFRPTKKKPRSTHRPFGRSSLKDPTVGFCCESRPCAQGSCQIWMKVDHIMIFCKCMVYMHLICHMHQCFTFQLWPFQTPELLPSQRCRWGEYEIEGLKDHTKSRYLATRDDLILAGRHPMVMMLLSYFFYDLYNYYLIIGNWLFIFLQPTYHDV